MPAPLFCLAFPHTAVIVVNYTVADGKSNWLEGMILMCLYLMLAVTFWFYPGASSCTGIANECGANFNTAGVNVSQMLAQC